MLILDTSVLLAALDADERMHVVCCSLLETTDEALAMRPRHVEALELLPA
jgi:predicted nucleic acid-binding protein